MQAVTPPNSTGTWILSLQDSGTPSFKHGSSGKISCQCLPAFCSLLLAGLMRTFQLISYLTAGALEAIEFKFRIRQTQMSASNLILG